VPELTDLIRDVPDFPDPGIVFRDITPLLADGRGLPFLIELTALAGRRRLGNHRVEAVVPL
jgi:adenine phosphoribosyltransferase